MDDSRVSTTLHHVAELAVLSLAFLSSATALAGSDGEQTNSVTLTVTRTDDYPAGQLGVFVLEVNVNIPSEPRAASVTVTTGDGAQLTLFDDGGGSWGESIVFGSFTKAKAAINGNWSVDITGAAPSTSVFAVDSDPLQETDFYDTAKVIYPQHGLDDVAPDGDFTWIDPTGLLSPYALVVWIDGVDRSATEPQDDSIFGGLAITDTDWNPRPDLHVGDYEFSVLYVSIHEATRISALTVRAGSIEWGSSLYAPQDYPNSTPLLALGSQTLVGFSVGSCSADLTDDGVVGPGDLAQVFGFWGTAQGVPADLSGDAVVGPADLAIVLGTWGPCS